VFFFTIFDLNAQQRLHVKRLFKRQAPHDVGRQMQLLLLRLAVHETHHTLWMTELNDFTHTCILVDNKQEGGSLN
jgi:hypothetical protein